MDYLYVVVSDGSEWEDISICDNEEHAIQVSKIYKKRRVEIFKKNNVGLFVPTYCYYKDGAYYDNM